MGILGSSVTYKFKWFNNDVLLKPKLIGWFFFDYCGDVYLKYIRMIIILHIISSCVVIFHSHVNRIIPHIHCSQGNRQSVGTSLIMFVYTFCELVLAEVYFFSYCKQNLSTFSFICMCIPSQP